MRHRLVRLLCRLFGHRRPRNCSSRYWVCARGCGVAVIEPWTVARYARGSEKVMSKE